MNGRVLQPLDTHSYRIFFLFVFMKNRKWQYNWQIINIYLNEEEKRVVMNYKWNLQYVDRTLCRRTLSL